MRPAKRGRPNRRGGERWLDPAAVANLPTELLADIAGLDPELTAIERAEFDLETARFVKYQNDPEGFIEIEQGNHLWSKTREIVRSVRDNRFTAVQSCHAIGKSWTSAQLVAWWLSSSPPGDAFVVTTAPGASQVRTVLWREINRAHRLGNLPGYTNQTEWHIGNEIVGMGRKPADYAPEAFQGIHARRVLVIIDEACGVSGRSPSKPGETQQTEEDNLWAALSSLIANEDSRMLAIGNPDDPVTEFAKICRPGSGWNVIQVSAFDTPNFTDEPIPDDLRPLLCSHVWVEERRKQWGEQSPLWKAKVLGEFPEVSDDTLIPIGWIRAAVNRQLDPGFDGELGVDVARFGSDESVIVWRRNAVFKIHGTARQRDLMYLSGMVIRALKETRSRKVKIDDSGLGGGVTDRVREVVREQQLPVEVVPVIVGQSPTRVRLHEKFFNLKAELFWQLRTMFEEGTISIEDDQTLLSQLASIRYLIDSQGRIRIEEKEDMKRRGLPSPDRAEALMLAAATIERPRRLSVFRHQSPRSIPLYAS